jgi:hypothetical protein
MGEADQEHGATPKGGSALTEKTAIEPGPWQFSVAVDSRGWELSPSLRPFRSQSFQVLKGTRALVETGSCDLREMRGYKSGLLRQRNYVRRRQRPFKKCAPHHRRKPIGPVRSRNRDSPLTSVSHETDESLITLESNKRITKVLLVVPFVSHHEALA